MMGTSSNGSRSSMNERGSSVEVVVESKRRHFSVEDKLRILRAADACSPGTVGAYLRREGIYSSQLYAWRRERERGDLDAQTLRNRAKQRNAERELEDRSHQLEVENRKLQPKVARLELFEEIRKKLRGSWGWSSKPRVRRERLIEVALELSDDTHVRTLCKALSISRSTLVRRREAPRLTSLPHATRLAHNSLSSSERAAVLEGWKRQRRFEPLAASEN